MADPEASSRPSVLDRAVQLLSCFERGESELPLTELAARTGLPKSSAHRFVNALAGHNLMTAVGDGRYRLGIRLWELGAAAVDVRLPLRMIERFAERVAADWDETCHVGILDGTDVVYVSRVAGTRAVAVQTSLGQRVPAHATATGMALLSGHSPEFIRERFTDPLHQFGPRTPGTVDELCQRAKDGRRRGYVVNYQGWQADLCGVAAPILDRTDTAIASIGIAGPTYRNDESRLHEMGDYVRQLAQEASAALGQSRH